MNTVATDVQVDQAVAYLGDAARTFLAQIHDGTLTISDVRGVHDIADEYMHRLRELARSTGAALDASPAYNANITNWRAVARLAGSAIKETNKAG